MSSTQNPDILPAGSSCQRCGLSTIAPELLIPDEKKRLYCPPCRITVFRQRALRGILPWLGVIILLDIFFSRTNRGLITLTGFSFLILPFIIAQFSTIIHEAGHALAAKAMNWEIHALSLGFGRVLCKFRVGRTLVSVRTSVFGGFCMAMPKQFTNRFLQEAAVMVLGGPMANFIAGGAMTAFLLLSYSLPHWVTISCWTFVIINFLLGILNLRPKVHDSFGAIMGSDGMQLKWIRTEPDKYRERHEYGQAMAHFAMARLFDEHERARQALIAMADRYPNDPLIRINLAATESELQNHEACLALSESLLQSIDNGETLTNPAMDLNPMYGPNLFRAMAYDNMATALLMLRRNLPEALECARYAYRISPWVPEVQATLGHALWQTGFPREGIPLMEEALKNLGDNPDSNRLRLKNLIAEAKAELAQ